MNWTPFMYGLGIGCEISIAAITVAIIVDSLVPNWRRIWDTACGRPWPIARHLVSPTASVLPLRTRQAAYRAAQATAGNEEKLLEVNLARDEAQAEVVAAR